MCGVPQGWVAVDVMGPDNDADDADSTDEVDADDVLAGVCLDPNFETIPNQD